MTAAFNAGMRELLDARNFATVATLNPDGGPQTSVVWILRDGNTVLFSSTAARQKTRNLARDPRVSLTVFDTGNPYSSLEIRGIAELTYDHDKALPSRLSRKYLDDDPPAEPDSIRRVIVRVIPQTLNGFSA